MDLFDFCDLESFLFYVWKLKEALRNKARAPPSLNTSLKSLEEHNKPTINLEITDFKPYENTNLWSGRRLFSAKFIHSKSEKKSGYAS